MYEFVFSFVLSSERKFIRWRCRNKGFYIMRMKVWNPIFCIHSIEGYEVFRVWMTGFYHKNSNPIDIIKYELQFITLVYWNFLDFMNYVFLKKELHFFNVFKMEMFGRNKCWNNMRMNGSLVLRCRETGEWEKQRWIKRWW